MQKKFFLAGMAAILGASLSFFACESATDGAAGTPGNSGTPGIIPVTGSVDTESLRGLIELATKTGSQIYFGNVVITDGGVVDFGNVTMTVAGTLATDTDDTTGPAILNLLNAAITFGDNGSIGLGDAGDYALVKPGDKTGTTGSYVTTLLTDGTDITLAVGPISAVTNYTLPANGTSQLGTLLVLETLTVNADSAPLPSTKVVPIKNVVITGPNASALADATEVDIRSATVTLGYPAATTSGAKTYTVTFDDINGTRFDITDEGDVLTVEGATSIKASLNGNGTFKAAEPVTHVDIQGSGRIQFSDNDPMEFAGNNSISAELITFDNGFKTPATPGTVELEGTVIIPNGQTIVLGANSEPLTLAAGSDISTAVGKVVLMAAPDADLTIDGGASAANLAVSNDVDLTIDGEDVTFDGGVFFGGNLTLTDKAVIFDANAEDEEVVVFADGKKITLGTATNITVTLKGALAQATPGQDGIPADDPDMSMILIADDYATPVVLTPATDNTTLTFGAADAPGLTQGGGTSGHTITISGGDATLCAGAAYTVQSAGSNVGKLKVDSGITLVLAPGDEETAAAELVLTAAGNDGAVLIGEGDVVAGGTTITGGDASDGWTAGGTGTGTVTVTEDSISGSAASLAFVAGHANSNITVAKDSRLEISSVAITLASSMGKVTISGDNSDATPTPGELLLKAGTPTTAGLLVVDILKTDNVTIGAAATADDFLLTVSGGSAAATDAKVTDPDKEKITAAMNIVITADAQDATSGSDLGTIGGGPDTDVLITGSSDGSAVNSEIVYGWKVQVTDD